MELGLFQEQKMKLAMTTELRQAISILEYSALELTEYIEDQSLENPFIELEEPKFNAIEPNTTGTNQASGNFKEDKNLIEYIGNRQQSFYDHLMNQARFIRVSKRQRYIIEHIILMLDKNGYFKEDLKDTANHLAVSTKDVEKALNNVKQLDPAGIGAENLRECLLIQLEYLYPNEETVTQIVAQNLAELADNKWHTIAEALTISLQEVQHAYDIIQTLNPRPTASIDYQPNTEYIVPDLTVTKKDESFTIHVNDQILPKIKMNTDYKTYLDSSDKNSVEATYLQKKYKNINWLYRSIEQRQLTLYQVMKAIVQEQTAFFHKGQSHLRPLTLKEIADICDVHESTVSRATNNKYVQTSHGLFELRHFFSSGIQTEGGDRTSSHKIKQVIKETIKEESPYKPLSDQQLTKHLKEKSILISRRTVAKYREQLGIPSSTNRKRY